MNLVFSSYAGWPRRPFRFFLSMLAAILCIACGGRNEADGTKPLTVTYGPQRWIVRQIAGDDFTVNVLLPPGSDPESYSPTVAQLRRLSQSDVWLHLNTAGFEQSLLSDMPSEGVRLSDTSTGVILLGHDHTHGEGQSHSHNHSEGGDCEDEGSADPHLWSSIRNTRIIAENTLNELTKLNPKKARQYRRDFLRLSYRLDSLDTAMTKALLQREAKAFLVWHPSLGYFARDYGLRQIALEDEGKEPSPIELGRRLNEARSLGVRTMITEPGFAGEQKSEFAREGGVMPLPVNLNSEEWLTEIEKLKGI